MSAPLKVINLGLPKSGTTTLGEALKRAGLRVADWRIRRGQDGPLRRFVGDLMYQSYFDNGDPLAQLGGFDAFTEIEIVRNDLNLWPQTDWALISAIRERHPGSRFLLNTRDPAAISASMQRWSNLGKRRLPGSSVPGLPIPYGSTDAERVRWIEGHFKFCRKVFENSDDFLEFDIADPEAPKLISDFLGIDLPWWGVANANPAEPAEDVS
ncbi:sulfotransferase [Frigidibacter sp. ROC022]|uniref:sulfotransferase n=1 Tax=Frigidibacter sp. ROC022 TaxID=2971796 RepID=UPI00215A4112|nr:sulfotransferase [Frigidibacter sp. ROC022]MCR8726815.1 sulfotransferase family protein [Frigidibacter sp. ROC022]